MKRNFREMLKHPKIRRCLFWTVVGACLIMIGNDSRAHALGAVLMAMQFTELADECRKLDLKILKEKLFHRGIDVRDEEDKK